jgi:RimJ/RimL family protein N-acetyltransferase
VPDGPEPFDLSGHEGVRAPGATGTAVIRPAEVSDARALVDLARAVGTEPGEWLLTHDVWREVGEERRYLKAVRRHPDAAVFVVDEAGAVVGRLSLARDEHPASRHVADIGLMVARGHRGRGIGRALLDQAVTWGRASAVRKLQLHVFPWNEPAIRLYERFGFVQEGVRVAHYVRDGSDVDAVLMAYRIP